MSREGRPLRNSQLLRPIRSSGKRLLTSTFHGVKTVTRASKSVLIPLVVAMVGSLLVIGCGIPPTGTSTKPTGSITEFVLPTSGSGPSGITAGPDGTLWFTENADNKIGRITTGK